MSKNLIEQVLKTTRNYGMLKPAQRVVAAVSGGPDSMFLLHALMSLRSKLKIKELCVCNLDHGLRAQESRDDSAFVERESRRLGLRFFHRRVNISLSSRHGLSTEELARQKRYDFYKETCERSDATIVATGHTLDDQAETVIMRIIKGASLKGIVGIAPVREEGAIRFVRPLIEIEKDAIVRYLDTAGIRYRVDSTNETGIYFRNVVRHEIIPFLQKYNPRLKRSLFSLAEHLREDFDFIHEAKQRCSGAIIASTGGTVTVSLKDIVTQPRAIQKEVLRDCLERCGGEVKKLSFRHWKEVEVLIRDKGKGFSVDLPGSIRATRTEKELVFKKL